MVGLQWVIDHKEEYGIASSTCRSAIPSTNRPPPTRSCRRWMRSGMRASWSYAPRQFRPDWPRYDQQPVQLSQGHYSGRVQRPGHGSERGRRGHNFSSRGPTLLDRVAKPDILAPGNRIVSLRAPGSHLDELFPDRRCRRPQPAGSHRLLRDVGHQHGSAASRGRGGPDAPARALLEPATVKARLMLSARKASVGDPFGSGAGALDIWRRCGRAGRCRVPITPGVA